MGLNVAPSPKDLWEASEYFEGTQLREILEWVVDTYDDGELVLSAFFSGAEGMTLIDMTSKITEEVTILTIDTRFLFKETHEFCKDMMRHHRLPLDVHRPALTVEEQVERYGERKRICSPDLCCQIRKIEPLERALKGYDAWVTGMRCKQTPQRASTSVVAWEERYRAAKIVPLALVEEECVYRYVAEHDVPINPLLKRGYKSIGREPQTRPVSPDEDARAGCWLGLDKTECGLHWATAEASS